MLALSIAIVALGLACIGLVAAGRALRQVAELAAEIADAAEDEPEPDSPELWVSDGDLHTPDAAALYEATGAIALCVSEGVPCAVVKGQGVVSLHKLLSEKQRPQAVK
jgi:hypothetical protein